MSLSDYNQMLELQKDIKTKKTEFQEMISDIKNDSRYNDLLMEILQELLLHGIQFEKT